MGSYNENAREWAERIRSGRNLAHEYLEKPAMYAALPNLEGKTVLSVGCGSGEECQHLASLGAKRVVGLDSSKGLIEVAKESYPNLEFIVSDMEVLDFPDSSFDFVYSSLTLHYKEDWTSTLKAVSRVMKADAEFLFSTHHPVTWGAEVERGKESKSKLLGYTQTGESLKIFGDYLNTRNIKDIWFNSLEVSFFHKPLSSILSDIRKANMQVVDFIEPKVVEAAKKVDMRFYEIGQKIPAFMIFKLAKVI